MSLYKSYLRRKKVSVEEICSKYGVSKQRFYKVRPGLEIQYAIDNGLPVPEINKGSVSEQTKPATRLEVSVATQQSNIPSSTGEGPDTREVI
jgi:hypothetical protein